MLFRRIIIIIIHLTKWLAFFSLTFDAQQQLA